MHLQEWILSRVFYTIYARIANFVHYDIKERKLSYHETFQFIPFDEPVHGELYC